VSFVASFTRGLGNILGVSPKKASAPAANPAVPTVANTTAEADAQIDEENKRRAMYGKSSTYLTSGGGAGLADTGTVSTSGLLGS
jgi:hypothetical protein